MTIVAKPLTPEEFAPYGDVLAPPADLGRIYYDQGLGNLRPTARPSLAVSHAKFLPTLPLEAKVMERHEFSSQSFVPLDVSRWLVIVAPSDADGGPDASRAMDGARFANAVARLGCTPAEASWKAGVDVLSFGATKNGALAAEAVVFFNRALAETM